MIFLEFRRFIPACAGTSAPRSRNRGAVAVHPRVCGDQKSAVYSVFTRVGSSPRVRGPERVPLKRDFLLRFIPACAGTRLLREKFHSVVAVHPRVCGDQSPRGCPRSNRNGSSPRVRGPVFSFFPAPSAPRFIPACAGTSAPIVTASAFCPVHPRVCGDQSRTAPEKMPRDGSSPRVRGPVLPGCDSRALFRFIPACAGTREPRFRDANQNAVHPRVCGDQVLSQSDFPAVSGSSPRVRGPVGHDALGTVRFRFIPACAGTKGSWVTVFSGRAVHPRVCGDQSNSNALMHIVTGSSPRVRGPDKDSPN